LPLDFPPEVGNMPKPFEREVLLDVIQRCAWLIDYYERTRVAPQSVQAFQETMAKAISDLEALAASVSFAFPEDLQNSSIECLT
jgi:hypothetical protein